MRIALVAPLVTPIADPQLGGSQALVADLARGLAARGHDVQVLASTGSQIPGVDVVDTGVDATRLAGALFRAGIRTRPTRAVHDAFERAWTIARELEVDVVHNHAFDAPAIELAPVGAVHTLHLPPDDVVAGAVRAARRRGPVTVAAVSRSHAYAWSKLLAIDAILPNGVPVDEIPWSAAGGTGAVYAGRLSPEKGAVEAIDIAELAGVEITVIGHPYDETYARELVAPRALVLPGQPRRELWTRMAASLAVLCPVAWDEPFGLVAAEAQACGTPVIGFDRGALREVVADGLTGSLVAPGDLDAAAAALMGAGRFDRTAVRAHAERSLDMSRTLDAHEALYARLANV